MPRVITNHGYEIGYTEAGGSSAIPIVFPIVVGLISARMLGGLLNLVTTLSGDLLGDDGSGQRPSTHGVRCLGQRGAQGRRSLAGGGDRRP